MKPVLRCGASLVLTLGVVTRPVETAAVESRGAELFAEHCVPCHGADGKAKTPAGKKLGAKDLSQSKLSDADIGKQIVNGTKDARGVDRMPPFREKVQGADVDALVAYVKTFRK